MATFRWISAEVKHVELAAHKARRLQRASARKESAGGSAIFALRSAHSVLEPKVGLPQVIDFIQ
jgi:hypothetical protein